MFHSPKWGTATHNILYLMNDWKGKAQSLLTCDDAREAWKMCKVQTVSEQRRRVKGHCGAQPPQTRNYRVRTWKCLQRHAQFCFTQLTHSGISTSTFPLRKKITSIRSSHHHSRDAGAEPRAPTTALNAGERSASVQSAQGIRPQKAVHGQEAIGKGSKERKEHSTANITLFR